MATAMRAKRATDSLDALRAEREPIVRRREKLAADRTAAEDVLASKKRALAGGVGKAAEVAAAKAIVQALADVDAELAPIDSEIARKEAARAAEKQRREAISRAVALSTATRAAIDAVGTARDAGIAALRAVLKQRHEMKTLQAEFGQILHALGGDDDEVLAELKAAAVDLAALNTITRPGDSTPLSHAMTSTLLRYPAGTRAAMVFDSAANSLTVSDRDA